MKILWMIGKREFLTTVKRKGYVVSTFGIPLFFLIVGTIAFIPGWMSLKNATRDRTVGILDLSGVVKPQLALEVSKEFKGDSREIVSYLQGKNKDVEKFLGKVKLEMYTEKERAFQDLEKGKILLFFAIPKDYLKTGNIQIYYPKHQVISRTQGISLFIKRLLTLSLIKDKVSPEVLRRIQKPFRITEFTLNKRGRPTETNPFEELGKIAVPVIFACFLVFSIVVTSAYLLQGLSEEKENRVMEILLSSVSSDQLFAGKLLGLEGAALLQLFIWSLFGVVPTLMFISYLHITPLMLVGCVVYCLLGVLLCGGLTIGFGALGTRFHESHQLSFVWSFLAILPIFFLAMILDSPNGLLSRLFSYFPLTSPVTMMLRLSAEKTALWDIPLTILILVLSIYFALKMSARLFQVGILLYGKKPGIRQIWKFFWIKKIGMD